MAKLLIGCACAGIFVALAYTDAKTMTIPNAFIGALGIVAVFAALEQVPYGVSLPDRVIGMFAISVPLLLIATLFGGLGGGDIKLMAAVGALLGWKLVLLAASLGLIISGIQAFYLVICCHATRKTAFPIGPALALGSACAYLVGVCFPQVVLPLL